MDEIEQNRGDLVELTRKLVQTESLSGHEGELATLISSEMKRLGFDIVRIDEAGNVLGSIGGATDEDALMFNGHMDHVPAADMPNPYSAEIKDGAAFGVSGEVIVGRAASDMKGALAAMIIAGSVLQELGVPLERRMTVAAVVMEETNGLGSRYLAESTARPMGVVIGESTNLDVALGHRGSMALSITTEGVSCHASAPERGVNALYKMVPILQGILSEADTLPAHTILGKSTMTATTISVNPNVKNVVPNLCTLGLDVRNTPNFPVDEVLERARLIVNRAKAQDPQINAKVELAKRDLRSYTGYTRIIDAVTPPFYTDPDIPLAQTAKSVVDRVLRKKSRFKVWSFATDGSYFADRGIPTVGFGPGEERFAHSPIDNIRVDDLIASAKVYAALTVELCM
jgi:putative selenium metabolism hydrolase